MAECEAMQIQAQNLFLCPNAASEDSTQFQNYIDTLKEECNVAVEGNSRSDAEMCILPNVYGCFNVHLSVLILKFINTSIIINSLHYLEQWLIHMFLSFFLENSDNPSKC